MLNEKYAINEAQIMKGEEGWGRGIGDFSNSHWARIMKMRR